MSADTRDCSLCIVARTVALLEAGQPGKALDVLDTVRFAIQREKPAEREAGREEGRAQAEKLAAGLRMPARELEP